MKSRYITLLFIMGLLSVSLKTLAEVPSRSAHEKMAREIYAKVIAMDTSVSEYGTPEMAAYLAELFKQAGFANENVIEVPISPNHTSLMVRYPGRDKNAQGIGFLAHMDVVTAFKKDWELDPFTLTERDGYFIGRGTADNKAGIVGLTAAFITLKKQGYVPDRNMILIFTADEESGMLSARHFATQLRDEMNIEYGINADGISGVLQADGKLLGYYVQGAEKSFRTVKLTVRNPGGHSSAPRADNAIYQLAAALTKIEAYKFPVMINEISAGMLTSAAAKSDKTTADAIAKLLADPSNKAADAIISQNNNLSTVIRTTCVATMLEAGHAENALPQSASATVNCRIMPGVAPEEVYRTLAEVIGDDGVKIESLGESPIAPASPMRDDVLAAIKYSVEDQYPDVELIPYMASYGTDGREFRAVGIPVYGSSGSFMDPDEAYAHGLNEKMPVESFYRTLGYWQRLMVRLTSNEGK
jgi:carboxypeptidase PM20D1